MRGLKTLSSSIQQKRIIFEERHRTAASRRGRDLPGGALRPNGYDNLGAKETAFRALMMPRRADTGRALLEDNELLARARSLAAAATQVVEVMASIPRHTPLIVHSNDPSPVAEDPVLARARAMLHDYDPRKASGGGALTHDVLSRAISSSPVHGTLSRRELPYSEEGFEFGDDAALVRARALCAGVQFSGF